MEPEPRDREITGPEAEAQLRFIERAIQAAGDDERRAALADGLLAFGPRFVMLCRLLLEQASGAALFQQITDEVQLLFVSWMKGRDLTSRADEPERRAQAAMLLLEGDDFADLAHYAAQAILELPEGHPRRDVEKARGAVRAQLDRYR